jgi:methylglutaconyl-CoA hydratase
MIRVETARGVTVVTLDSPHNRNALSRAMIDELLTALTRASTDASVRVIVLSHTGPVFCSGADLTETAGGGDLPVARLGDVLSAIWESPKPVIARVGGTARAGGLGLVAAADIAVCTDEVSFAFTEVRLGVIPAVISATVLRRLAPRAAAELFLTGESFDGRRAADIGLVTAAVAAADLDSTVARLTAAVLRGAPNALAGTKRLLNGPANMRGEQVELTALSVRYFGSAEAREGISAFRERRAPSWAPQGELSENS